MKKINTYWLGAAGFLGLFSTATHGAQFVDYFHESTVEVFEKKDGKFVATGARQAQEILKTCPAGGSASIRIKNEVGNFSELTCGTGSMWVRNLSFEPQVAVDVNCTKPIDVPGSKKQVIVIAGTRGAGAEKNGCK